MFVGLAFCFPFAWENVQLDSWVCYKASIALRNARKVVLCEVNRNGSCVARFARDNAYSAAPTALPRQAGAGGITIIDVPALPGWADVWRTALRASTMRYPAHCREWSKVCRPALGADV
jgi:hypothetical protein